MIRSFNSEETGHLKENVCVKDVGEHSGIIIGVSEAIHVFGCFCLRRPEKKKYCEVHRGRVFTTSVIKLMIKYVNWICFLFVYNKVLF
jgi:hypothetical protein